MQPATPLLQVRALARHYAGVAALRERSVSWKPRASAHFLRCL